MNPGRWLLSMLLLSGCAAAPPPAEAGRAAPSFQHLAVLEGGIVTHVPFLEIGSELGQDALDDGAHLTAEPAVGFAEEDERRPRRAQDAVRGAGPGARAGSGARRFQRVARPAPMTTRTIAAWTSTPVKSG